MACNECLGWRGADPRAKKTRRLGMGRLSEVPRANNSRRLGAVPSFLLRKPDLWARHCPEVAIF